MGTPAVLRGHVKFNSQGEPFIEWIEKRDQEAKIRSLEERIQALERRMGSSEKA
jgi:hypothetical protein